MRMTRQTRIAGGGVDRGMTEDLLYIEQINARFDQMRGVAMAQTVGGDLFFNPQSATA